MEPVSVQLALAGRAVASTGSATEEAYQSGIRLRDDPPGRPCRVEAGWEDHNTGVRRVVPDLSSTSLEAAQDFYGDILGPRPVTDHG